MPFVDDQGVRIRYEVEGAGPPLVLRHGFTNWLEQWYDAGYVDALRGEYRCILLDARGHACSQR